MSTLNENYLISDLTNDFFEKSLGYHNNFFEHGDWRLVGHGEVTIERHRITESINMEYVSRLVADLKHMSAFGIIFLSMSARALMLICI